MEISNQILEIEKTLAGSSPEKIKAPGSVRAAVAMILGGPPAAPEVLFIERARHDGDPWSGDIGFPGGKLEPGDAGPREAAERETAEEVALDLNAARYLGRLDDIAGAHLPIVVSCFVYHFPQWPPMILAPEVEGAFRVPLGELFAPGRHLETHVIFGAEQLLRPAIRLPVSGYNLLWGITYRLVCHFQEMLKR